MILKLVLLALIYSIPTIAKPQSDETFLQPYILEIDKDIAAESKNSILKRSAEDLDELHSSVGTWLRNEKLRKKEWSVVNSFFQRKGFKTMDDVSADLLKRYREKLMLDLPESARNETKKKQTIRHRKFVLLNRISNECSAKIQKNAKSIKACFENPKDFDFIISKQGGILKLNGLSDDQANCVQVSIAKIKLKHTELENDLSGTIVDFSQCRIKEYYDLLNE